MSIHTWESVNTWAEAGIAASVGQVTETDSVQPIAVVKRLAVGQAVEANASLVTIPHPGYTAVELVNPITTAGSLLEGYSDEPPVTGDSLYAEWVTSPDGVNVDLVPDGTFELASRPLRDQTISRFVIQADGTVGAEADYTALFTLQAAANQSAETDTALPITVSQSILQTVNTATESDSAQSVVASVTLVRSVGQVVENDLANGISVDATFVRSVGQASENNIAQPISQAGELIVLVGQVLETDVAQAVNVISPLLVSVGIATETDVAQGISSEKLLTLGQPAESDSAQSISLNGVFVRLVGQATETDFAQTISPPIAIDLGWEDDDNTWGGIELGSKFFSPIFAAGDEFFLLGGNATDYLTMFLERRSAIHEKGFVVSGGMVYPLITGPTGSAVRISLGSHDTPDGAIDWEGPYDFVIGEDFFVDFNVTGRYLAVRFESSSIPVWQLQSYKIEYEVVGKA